MSQLVKSEDTVYLSVLEDIIDGEIVEFEKPNSSLQVVKDVPNLVRLANQRDNGGKIVVNNYNYHEAPKRVEPPADTGFSIYTIDFQSASMVIFSGILIVVSLLGIALASRPIVFSNQPVNGASADAYR